jgi:putative flippase GtrA
MVGEQAGTLLRSSIAGILATAADLLALFVLVHLCAVPAPAANVPALLVGVTLQYLGNKHYAFRDCTRTSPKQVGLFALVEVGTFALNAGAFHVLVTAGDMPYYLARLVGTAGVYLGFSYPLWWGIFGRGARPGEPAPS